MRRYFLFLALFLLAATGCRPAAAEPSILFLRPGPNGAAQLFHQAAGDPSARQLTGLDDPHAPEVIDFAVAPSGQRIAYTAITADGGSAIHLIGADGRGDERLADCPQAECSAPVWSPDGGRLIYELRPRRSGLLDSPRLHWLDADTGETLPLIEGNETPGYGARFSPDGRWLSYVSLADDGVVLYRMADGAQRLLSSRVGSPAAWSPDSAAVVYGDLVVQGHATAPDVEGAVGELPVQESSTVFLYRTMVGEETTRRRLSPDAAVADSAPAFSPDGQWIAFGRAPANTAAGRQLWIMRADGSEARALTSDPAVTHGPPGWSPDGRTLLFQRYDPAAETTSVWRLDVATGAATRVAEDGYLPAWLN